MGRKKISTTVYLEADQDISLKALSKKTMIPVAKYIRIGIEKVIAEAVSNGDIPNAADIVTAKKFYGKRKRDQESDRIEASIERVLRRMIRYGNPS